MVSVKQIKPKFKIGDKVFSYWNHETAGSIGQMVYEDFGKDSYWNYAVNHPTLGRRWVNEKSLSRVKIKPSERFNGIQNGGGLSQHIDAAFDAAASGDRGGLTTTKAAIRKALNSAKQPEGQKAREYIFGVLDIIVKNRSKWSGAQTQKAVREYSSAVYDRVLPKLNVKANAFGEVKGGIQLPNDVINKGYKETRPYHHEQVFYSPSLNFTGTEKEFIKAGHAYEFRAGRSGERIVKRNPSKVVSLGDPLADRKTAAKYVALQSRNYPNNEYRIVKKGDYYYAAYMGKKAIKNSDESLARQIADRIEQDEYELKKISQSGLHPKAVTMLKKRIASDRKWLKESFNISPKKNETATDFHAFKENKSKEHFKMFQGKQSSGAVRVLQPDSAPKETSRLGDLVLMKVIKSNGSRQNINFDGEAFLAIDLRKNLWAIGKDARINNIALPRKGELKYLGKLKQIDYVTAKKHIGGNKLTRFWHELGEVDKNYPSLYVDADGFPIIHGGGYDVWNIGIVN